MWTREELKRKAKNILSNNYGQALAISLILGLASGGSSGTVSRKIGKLNQLKPEYIAAIMGTVIMVYILIIALKIFVINPLKVGCIKALSVNEGDTINFSEIGIGFKNYKKNVYTMFLMELFVSLWSLLLVIPGIIKGLEYKMVPYLLANNPEMTTEEIFAKSKEMMMGNKMDAFVLGLSFIGWILLGIITCGIGLVFYVNPYMLLTDAQLYMALRDKDEPVYYESTIDDNIYQ